VAGQIPESPRLPASLGTTSQPRVRKEPAAMAIQVRIPTILRSYTGGVKTVDAKGDSLSALFDDLETSHPGLRARLITEEGALHRFVNVYVNDEDVRFTGALETPLNDGDSVTILPAVAGGAGTVIPGG
jgi:molybdopterin synthase sulfur carrier subunit